LSLDAIRMVPVDHDEVELHLTLPPSFEWTTDSLPHARFLPEPPPAGMIFIPCKDGISHNEIEDARPDHIEAGCNVLLHAMLERAGVVA
jgi:acetylornithine deacetylase/succinyl-diaminopimelate desuccinylase-like protein